MARRRFIAAAIFSVLGTLDVSGQSAALPSTDDKTGIDPLNIQTTVSVINDFVSLPKANRPYTFCAIPYDTAGNAGAIFEALLP